MACTDVPCPKLEVQWLNLEANVERRSHMARVLRTTSKERCKYPSMRVEAVKPTCTRGAPCTWNGSTAAWSAHDVFRMERSTTKRYSDARRAGALGTWLSHVSLWRHFAQRGADGPDFLLILEDDVSLEPDFFRRLPCLLRSLPHPWHVLRFSTWGARFAADEIITTSTGANVSLFNERVFHAKARPYDGSGYAAFPYGGTHAVIVAATTVDHLVDFAVANGVMAIDVALRERPPADRPQHAFAASHLQTYGAAASRGSIVSLVVFTPAVSVMRSLGSWRRLSNGTQHI